VLNAASEKIGELFHRHEERHKNIDISTSTARQTNEQSQRHHMWRTCCFTTWLFADVLVQAQLVHAQQDINHVTTRPIPQTASATEIHYVSYCHGNSIPTHSSDWGSPIWTSESDIPQPFMV